MGTFISKCCLQCFIGSEDDNYSDGSSTPDSIDINIPARAIGTPLEEGMLLKHQSVFFEYLEKDESLKTAKTSDLITVKTGEEDKYFIIKCMWRAKFTPRQFLDYYLLLEERAKWDNTIDAIESKGNIVYTSYKKVGLISRRDLLTYGEESQFGDGILYLYTSVCHEQFPEIPGIVRIELVFAGIFVRPLSENSSQVTYIGKMDMRGTVSMAMTKNLTALSIFQSARNMNGLLESYYRENNSKC